MSLYWSFGGLFFHCRTIQWLGNHCTSSDVKRSGDAPSWGQYLEVHISHWSFKEVPEGIDVDQWMNGSAQAVRPQALEEDSGPDEMEHKPVIETRVRM